MDGGAVMVSLPVPPSTNHLFVNLKKGGRMTNRLYTAWKMEAGLKLNRFRSQAFGKMPVSVTLFVPRKPASRDIDNFAKAPLDLLVSHKIIDDDKYIERLLIERHDDANMIVSVIPFQPAAKEAA
jgi:Holliday junction resolvase RusA-like endonuclease